MAVYLLPEGDYRLTPLESEVDQVMFLFPQTFCILSFVSCSHHILADAFVGYLTYYTAFLGDGVIVVFYF